MALYCTGCSLIPGRQLENLPSAEQPRMSANFQSPRNVSQSRPVEKLPAPRLEMNALVKRELNLLLKGNGRYVRECLDRRDRYYPVMAQIFEDEGVPHDLISLALIESGYNTHARSRVGAVGMWQFMKSTARLYGLSVSLFEDQRKDPILSTIAAARHLRDLYQQYKDWYLALAAYNAGPGAVQQAIAKSGSTDFWRMSRRGIFTKQTRDFVPRFIAAALITRSPEAFGVEAGGMLARLGTLPQENNADDTLEKVSASSRYPG